MDEFRVIILGSTGSIGTQALEVIAHLNALFEAGQARRRFRIVGLAARNNTEFLARQAMVHSPQALALVEGDLSFPSGRVFRGEHSAEELVREIPCDLVLAAIVGSAGLRATLAAIEQGCRVGLANKESLVAAGELVVPAARKRGVHLLPIDSEHAGVWQCLGTTLAPPLRVPDTVSRVVLTASGGPFRTWPIERMHGASRAEALKHPTWSMGSKVTVDSASLMNKALELIEAHWLFGLPASRLGAIVHPQSIVHALIEHADGNVVAHLASPDMRTPIQHALTWPARVSGCARRTDLASLGRLDFEPVDPERFPAILLADRAMRAQGTAGALLNAANEEAVGAFLRGDCSFGTITHVVGDALDRVGVSSVRSLDDVASAEREARRAARSALGLDRAV